MSYTMKALDRVRNRQMVMEDIMRGRMMWRSLVQPVAPSMLAASITSWFNPMKPAT